LPESWARFCSLIRVLPGQPLPKNELLDIFYNGLTVESKTYLDSYAYCVFRKRTPAEAEELMAKIARIMMIGIYLSQHQRQHQRSGE
jgi:hypothetical protein